MELHDMSWANVTIKSLPDLQKDRLKWWRMNVLDDRTDKVGLWIYGPRNSGTTYAAKCILGRMAFDDDCVDLIKHIEADKLVRMLRQTWTGSTQVRSHTEDLGLWRELQELEQTIEYLFEEAPILWIDDLWDDRIDWNIWRKNFQSRVEERAKNFKPTVVCTTLPPNHPFLPKGVIDTLFVTVGMLHGDVEVGRGEG